MEQFEINTAAYRFIANSEPEQVMVMERGREMPKADATTGELVWKVSLSGNRTADNKGVNWLVKVNGKPDLEIFDRVDVEGLVATYWENGGNSGISFKADSVIRQGAATKPAPTTKAPAEKAA